LNTLSVNTLSTNWLSSETVYYNTATKKIGHYINDVIDYSNLEFDEEGLNNYLLFGYSVLGNTPVKNVNFLPPASSIQVNDTGELKILSEPEAALKNKFAKLSEDDLWDLVKEKINHWVSQYKGEIVIPTSGGFDSRLLNLLVEDKSRIRSFTYGVSSNQADSFEVVYAKKVAEVLHTKWEQIPIGDFNLYLEDWNKIYGPSTHAHGMYHIEFYRKILPKVEGGNPFLSGIIGDAWSGKVVIPEINSVSDVEKLAYSHGISIPQEYHQKPSSNLAAEKYFEEKKEFLKDPDYRIIESMRMKMILLNYLLRIPRAFHFKPWSPFLDIEIVMAMLQLPLQRKLNRNWQADFLKKNGLHIESMNLIASKGNAIDFLSMKRVPLAPLKVSLLKEIVKVDLIDWINRKIYGMSLLDYYHWGMAKLLSKAHIGPQNVMNNQLTAYYYYMILWPIQSLLEKREN
jgi:hypothetical protein